MAQPRFAMPLPRTLRSASLRLRSALVAMPSPADGVLCPCLPMPCTAPAMRAFAVPCRRCASLANALAMPSSPRKAAALNRYAVAMLVHAIAARTAPCSCWAMRRPAPQPRSCASPPLFCALRCSAAAKQRLALQRRSCPTQSSAVAMPTFALAVLSQAMPLPCSALPQPLLVVLSPAVAGLPIAFPSPCQTFPRLRDALSRSAFASPCSALPPRIGAPTCLATAMLCFATASPCSASALLCHPSASPSLAIALLRRATPLQRSPEHSRRPAMRFTALPLPLPASLFLSPALPCDSSASQRSSVPPLCSVVRLHKVASPSRLRAFPCKTFAARLAALPSRGTWFRVVCWRVARMPLRRPERAVFGALAMWVG